jgi:hypothetical protein
LVRWSKKLDSLSAEAMIDTHARTRFAGLIRQLAAGLVTNDQFEDHLPQSNDPAVHEVYFAGVAGSEQLI